MLNPEINDNNPNGGGGGTGRIWQVASDIGSVLLHRLLKKISSH